MFLLFIRGFLQQNIQNRPNGCTVVPLTSGFAAKFDSVDIDFSKAKPLASFDLDLIDHICMIDLNRSPESRQLPIIIFIHLMHSFTLVHRVQCPLLPLSLAVFFEIGIYKFPREHINEYNL